MSRGQRWCAAASVALMVGLATPAIAGSPGSEDGPPSSGPIDRLWQLLDRELPLAIAAATPPPPPPVPVKVTWKAKRVASLDLGAALLAMAVGDLDGDGRAELVALTERAVVVLSPARRGIAERARLAVPSEPAAVWPRDPIGALAIAPGDGGVEIWARSSAAGRGARYRLIDGGLREVGPVVGFPFCAGQALELVPGRNLVAGPDGASWLARRCRDDVVDPTGRPLVADATLATDGGLAITVATRCRPGAECPANRTITAAGVGVAFELDDVDRDGKLELITSAAGAPGDPDAVMVRQLGSGGLTTKPVFQRSFSGGVVALASGDVDGDGDRDVFAAVRLAGARKVDLWLLD